MVSSFCFKSPENSIRNLDTIQAFMNKGIKDEPRKHTKAHEKNITY